MEDKTKEYLTEQEAEYFKEFLEALNQEMFAYGFYNPTSLNHNIKTLNGNPLKPTYDKIMEALSDPMNRWQTLQEYASWMEYAESTFKKTIDYYAHMLSFGLSYTAVNVTDKKEYKSTRYKKDKEAVEQFLTSFDYEREFANAVHQIIRSGAYFTFLRNNDDAKMPRYTLQTMPQNYCMITGRFAEGYLYDFDANYFDLAGTTVEGYDPSIIEAVANLYKNGQKPYNPMNSIGNRNSAFCDWIQTKPICVSDNGLVSGAWVFTLDESNPNNVPMLAHMMKDVIHNVPLSKIQHDKNLGTSYGYLVGSIPMLKTNEPNNTAFTPKTLGSLMAVAKKALGDSIALGALPLNEVKMHQLTDTNKDMYSSTIATSVTNGAGASRILFASDKMSETEVIAAVTSDYNIMASLYKQFNSFLNFYVNHLTKKYKFQFYFDGANYDFLRNDKFEMIMKLAERGIVPNETVFASAMGMHPVMFSKMLMETSAEDSWIDNLSQLTSVHTQSGSAVSNKNNIDRSIDDGQRGRLPKESAVEDDEVDE